MLSAVVYSAFCESTLALFNMLLTADLTVIPPLLPLAQTTAATRMLEGSTRSSKSLERRPSRSMQ
jgi:hypothetical protein